LPDRDHGSIIDPLSPGDSSDPTTQQLLGKLILQALDCDTFDAYQALTVQTAGEVRAWRDLIKAGPTWADITEATAALAANDVERSALFGGDPPPATYFHQYMQVVAHVVDDHGLEVADYFLEFFAPGAKADDDAVYFHTKVLEDVHPFKADEAFRCLFVDHTDLVNEYYNDIPPGGLKQVAMSISAVRPGDNIGYFHNSRYGAAGHMVVHRQDEADPSSRWLKHNCTHFVQIIIPRVPEDRVFKLTKLLQGDR
jgi:hypothetical protein